MKIRGRKKNRLVVLVTSTHFHLFNTEQVLHHSFINFGFAIHVLHPEANLDDFLQTLAMQQGTMNKGGMLRNPGLPSLRAHYNRRGKNMGKSEKQMKLAPIPFLSLSADRRLSSDNSLRLLGCLTVG